MKKKLILTGTLLTTIAPLAVVVSCGADKNTPINDQNIGNNGVDANSNQQKTQEVDESLLPTLEQWRAAYPQWQLLISDDYKVADGAFINEALPNGFMLPKGTKEIGNRAFENVKLPNGFVLPRGITKIGKRAFMNVQLPNSFTLPSSVQKIDEQAFFLDNNHNTFYPSNHTYQPEQLMLSSNFKIPNSTISIGSQAFVGWKLPENFEIPNTVTSMSSDAFDWKKLPEFNYWSKDGIVINDAPNEEGHTYQVKKDYVNLEFRTTYPNALTPDGKKIVDSAFRGNNLPSNFTIPQSVEEVGDFAFKGANLPSNFVIPSGIKIFGKQAFDSHLPNGYVWHSPKRDIKDYPIVPSESYIILKASDNMEFRRLYPNALSNDGKKINDNAFKFMTLPSGFALPASVAEIGQNAFVGATFADDFVLPDSITEIAANVFGGAHLPNDFKLSSNVTKIGEKAFQSAQIKGNFTIPKSVVIISDDAFEYAGIPSGYLWGEEGKVVEKPHSQGKGFQLVPDKINFDFRSQYPDALSYDGKKINDHAFSGKVISGNFVIPNSVEEIGDYAFDGSKFESAFAIPKTILKVGDHAFYNIYITTSFQIPNTLKNVGNHAFEEMRDIKNDLFLVNPIYDSGFRYGVKQLFWWFKDGVALPTINEQNNFSPEISHSYEFKAISFDDFTKLGIVI